MIRYLLTIAACAPVYLAFAFAKWDMDPGNWGQDARVACAIIMPSASIMAAISLLRLDDK